MLVVPILVLTLVSVVSIGALIWAISAMVSVIGGAQLVATPRVVIDEVITLAELTPRDRFIELGSGLGPVAGAVARATQAQVVGVELSPLWVWLARLINRGSGATFRVGNVFTTELESFNVVYCYLLPPMLERLTPRFRRELKPGSRIITYAFPLPGWTPSKTLPRTKDRGPIYCYLIG